MTDREKLVELLERVMTNAMYIGSDNGRVVDHYVSVENLADHLLAHGATVKPMQKPLTVDETFNSRWSDPNLWIEMREKETLFLMHGGTFTSESYGKIWRCWAEKPTEEERKAAKWEN